MKVRRITERKDMDNAFYIRKVVFVEEQGVPLENEIDEYEEQAEHVIVYYNNQPAATGRLRIVNNVAKLERICVVGHFRKFGLGKVVVQELEKIAKEIGVEKAKLHSQTHAKGFYEKLGYEQKSDEFMEECIPHVLMKKNL